jgi:hypothetical protein
MLLTWCIENRSPVFVAAFMPVVHIIASVIDFCNLHEQLYVRRYRRSMPFCSAFSLQVVNWDHLNFVMCDVLGSVLMIGGLYLLLWGKRQEAFQKILLKTTTSGSNHRRRTEDLETASSVLTTAASWEEIFISSFL